MATYCGKCGQSHNYPMSSVRASRTPCDFCGGHDQIRVRTRGGEEMRNLPNYSYPDNLLPTLVETTEDNE